jgi:hypothetical protein
MRVLIIALARSGGHQLNEWLALELGHKIIHEPKQNIKSITGDNIVVKYLINTIENIIDIDFTNWDKVIGLTREDTMECAISQTKALQTSEWRIEYEVNDEWIKENEKDIKMFEEWANKLNEYINNIKEIQLRVTYEGIYNTKEDIQRIKDYIGIINLKYEYLLDNKRRLRGRKLGINGVKIKKELI